jgi:DNA-binding HxlR family transcriptional regulator/putative sterol carrier protein
MAGPRTYGEGCATSHALDLVGERWALLVVRELLLGPKRFRDLRAGVAHESPNVLAQRLRELEQAGVVRRRRLPPPASANVYELTEWGAELEPVVMSLGRWGARSPALAPGLGMSVDAHVLALRTMFAPAAAGDLAARFELRLGEDRYRVAIADGAIHAARGEAPDADATIRTDPSTLLDVAFGVRTFADARRAGDLEVTGDAGAAARLAGICRLPAQAASDVPAA